MYTQEGMTEISLNDMQKSMILPRSVGNARHSLRESAGRYALPDVPFLCR